MHTFRWHKHKWSAMASLDSSTIFLIFNFHSLFFRHGKGPYYVEVFIMFEHNDDTGYFMLELPSFREMPHSVSTFLSLAQSDLYHGTAIVGSESSSNLLVKALDEESLDPSALLQKKRVLGYGDSAISFEETSKYFGCAKNSVGFVELGPGLEFFTSEPDNKASGRSCFAKVSGGSKVFDRIGAALTTGEKVEIVELRLPKKKKGSPRIKDEL